MSEQRLATPPMFGVFVVPLAAEHRAVVQQVLVAERTGLDLIGIQDHPYQRRFLDTFVLLADLLTRTERIRFFPDVANLPLRGPVMIAKAAASLDVMSDGRLELGIGAGTFWDAVAGMGGPRRRAGESIDALDEAMRIIRAALDGERVVRGAGPHYPVPGYPPGPPPAHRVELWVGVQHSAPSLRRAWTRRSPGQDETPARSGESTTLAAPSPTVRSAKDRSSVPSTSGSRP